MRPTDARSKVETPSSTASPAPGAKPGIAVVGTGSAGMRHLAALRALGECLPIGVPKRPSRVGELEGAGYCVATDLEDAVGQGASMCVIATDTSQHLEDCLQVLELGLDVLVEKPLTANAIDAWRLVNRARQNGRKIFVGCNLRFSQSLGRFRDWLPRLGRLHSVRVACQSFLPDWRPDRPYLESYSARDGEGGVLLDLIHEIDYTGWIFGWPTSVLGRLRNTGQLGIKTEEMAELTWETPNGCIVSIGLDYLSRIPFRGVRASGSEGIMEWDGMQDTVTLMLAGHNMEQLRLPTDQDGMFSAQDRAFMNTCAGTQDLRLATGVEGVRALAICDAVRRSSASGSEAVVEQVRESE